MNKFATDSKNSSLKGKPGRKAAPSVVKGRGTVNPNHKQAHAAKAQSLKGIIDMARPLLVRRQALLCEKTEFDKKYVMVDVKSGSNPIDDKLKLVDMEIDAIKKFARTAFGSSHLSAKLVQSLVFASTVTTGVVNGVFALTAAALTDFGVLAQIFEEYKMVGGQYEFLPTLAASSATGVVNNGTQFGAISYNPVQGAASTSAAAIADDTNHMIWMPAQVYLNVQAGIGIPARPDKFHFKIAAGVIDDTVVASSGQWLSCATTNIPYGYLRVFMITASSTVIANAINGLLTMKLEFRMRV